MPRHPRIHAPNLLYHITARGNNRQGIFKEKEDFKKFLEYLSKTKKRYPFKLYAYVLMPNHFHLLAEEKKDTTSRIMQSLLTTYSRYFNYTHKRTGHLFQGRYKAFICEKENYFFELIRYIHLNPIRANLARNLNEWEWSGHREYTGETKRGLIDFGLIRGVFGEGEKGYKKYTKFLEDGTGVNYRREYHPKDIEPFIGPEDFILKLSVVNRPEKSEKREKDLTKILEKVSEDMKIEAQLIKSKKRCFAVSKARKSFIRESVLDNGHSQKSVARFLNCDEGYITRIVRDVE